MTDLLFDEQIPSAQKKRLKRLDEWFQEYAAGGLLGEELDPGPMDLARSAQPTICMVEDIDSIEVLKAVDLGDGVLEAVCSIVLAMELDLNNEDWDSATRSATMVVTLTIHTRGRKIAGHHLHDAYAPED